MKLYSTRVLLTSSWLLMTMITPVAASTVYSPAQCEQLAVAIVNGERPPLNEQELADLDPETVAMLTKSLIQAREHPVNSQPAQQIDHPTSSTESQGTQSVSQSDNLAAPQQEPAEQLPLTKNQAAFIDLISHDAQEVATTNDLFASVLIAQAILESDWGHSDLAHYHNNLFGIKGSYQGQSVALPTGEHLSGQNVQISANFRKYPRVRESLLDYANVMNQEIYEGVHKRAAKNYQEATKALNNVYATDPGYSQKLNRLIESYNLTQYDNSASPQQKNTHNPRSSAHRELAHRRHLSSDNHEQTNKKKKSFVIPMLGGLGSMSLVEIIKRYVK